MTFYDVKTRSKVEVADENLTKTTFTRTTNGGVEQTRYALRGKYDGRDLTRFVSQADYDSFNVPVQ